MFWVIKLFAGALALYAFGIIVSDVCAWLFGDYSSHISERLFAACVWFGFVALLAFAGWWTSLT